MMERAALRHQMGWIMSNEARRHVTDQIALLEQIAAKPVEGAAGLEAMLGELYRSLITSDLAQFDVSEVRSHALGIMQRLFELRLRLRQRIDVWQQAGYFSPTAQGLLRDVFRASRYASDMLGEVYAGNPRKGEDEPALKAFEGGELNVRLAPRFAESGMKLEAGDVILVRGALHNSAAIARIGDVASQFSHVGIVHFDKKGKGYLVEALIAEGAVPTPLDHALSHDLARAVVFRYRDATLAAKAAQLMFRRVYHSRRWYGAKILYDFSMRLESYKRLFCSKLVREGFDRASGGRVLLPSYPTTLRGANRDFLSRIGVGADVTFAPGDLELEQDFQIVAEWNDYRVTPTVRLHDLATTKLFEWMEHEDWRFKEDWSIHLIAWLGRLASVLSDDAKTQIESVVPKVPVNMPRRTIATIAMLHKTSEQLYAHLRDLEVEALQRHGRPLHPVDVFAALDNYRAASDGVIGYLRAPAVKRQSLPLATSRA